MPTLRVIGDLHGDTLTHENLMFDKDYSVQIGDLGVYGHLRKYDASKHRAFFGNHDNYGIDKCFLPANILTNGFGPIYLDGKDYSIFYVRGAWSIDHKFRTPGLNWFPEEELSNIELASAYTEYKNYKPEIMLTHEAPNNIVKMLDLDPTFPAKMGYPNGVPENRTRIALQDMFDIHQPKYWIFGHYHTNFDEEINGTRFICLTADRSFRDYGLKQYFDISL